MKKHYENMSKNLILFIGIIMYGNSFAQVGINTSTPDNSANLHVESNSTIPRGTLLNPMTTAIRNTIASPANGLIVYDTDLKCLMTNNGTPSSPDWKCTNDGADGAGNESTFKHFYNRFIYATMTTNTGFTTSGATRPSSSQNYNVVGYLTNNDPTKLTKVPVIDGLRMNVVFFNKGAGTSGAVMSPIIENISGAPFTDLVLYNSSSVSGVKRVSYTNFANNAYINVDADGLIYYDLSNFETCTALVNHNGKMYRCTWWGFADNTTHYIHMSMEVFD
jgi:hypothetical protein